MISPPVSELQYVTHAPLVSRVLRLKIKWKINKFVFVLKGTKSIFAIVSVPSSSSAYLLLAKIQFDPTIFVCFTSINLRNSKF